MSNLKDVHRLLDALALFGRVDPVGETWAGRGVRPRWLVAAIKGGKKLDDFLIDKLARKGRKKRRSKR